MLTYRMRLSILTNSIINYFIILIKRIKKMKRILTTCRLLLCIFGCSNNGIHPVSKGGVYLQGEACTINMPFKRPVEEISNDFQACLTLHEHYSAKLKEQ